LPWRVPGDEISEMASRAGMKSRVARRQEKVLRGLTTAGEVARALLGAEDVETVLD
jgi:type II secretory ATPase GspE/PulE/Tfp pilus assembly ATPase PilB-like protein